TPASAPVTVRLSTTGQGTGSAILDVADRGPGMAAAEADRIFERFYRADASRSRTEGGSGLGLAIVAALVAGHAGTVTVDTAPGEGATFRVRLPLANGTTDA